MGGQEGWWEAEERVGRRWVLRVRRGGQGGETGRKGRNRLGTGRWDMKAGTAAGRWWVGQDVSWESGGRDIQGVQLLAAPTWELPGARCLCTWVPVCVMCVGHCVCTTGPHSHASHVAGFSQRPLSSPSGVWPPPHSGRSLKGERGWRSLTVLSSLAFLLGGRWSSRGPSLDPAPLLSGSFGKGLDDGGCSS